MCVCVSVCLRVCVRVYVCVYVCAHVHLPPRIHNSRVDILNIFLIVHLSRKSLPLHRWQKLEFFARNFREYHWTCSLLLWCNPPPCADALLAAEFAPVL